MRKIERPKQQEEHIDTEGSWAVSYGDMITLLMSFFVLYFTVDQTQIKQEKLDQQLMVRLENSGMHMDQSLVKDQLNIGYEPGDGIEERVVKDLGGRIYKYGKGLLVDFTDTSFFDFGKIDVTKDGAQVLERFAKIYEPFAGNYRLQVQAFTDTRRVRSDNPRFRDNLELSALRSVASVRVLQKSGIPLHRMKIAGFGELTETREHMMMQEHNKDPLKYSRKVVLYIEPIAERIEP